MNLKLGKQLLVIDEKDRHFGRVGIVTALGTKGSVWMRFPGSVKSFWFRANQVRVD